MMRGKRVRMDTQLLELCIYGKKKVFLRKKKKFAKKEFFFLVEKNSFFQNAFFFTIDTWLILPVTYACYKD
jgi:hypothetical protein